MSTNKFSKYVIDNIVVGTPISSIVAAGATIGLDSAAVTALIDSDYVQQRESSGLDSAEVIALIDSDYVSARTPAANGGGLDSAAALDLFAYGIEEVGANQRQAAISLNTFVDPFNQTGNTDRAFNLNYTSTTGMFIRETGGRTEIHADASGTGQSTGLLLIGASFGNNGTEIVGNVKLSSLPTTDPAETGLLWNDGGIPVFSGSTAPTGGAGLDSAAVEGIVDSAYVQARQTPQDFAYSSLTGAPTALSSFTNDTNYITAADIPATVDSDYVQARVTLDGVGLDSAGVTALVDSDYVALRAPAASGGLDSAAVLATVGIDSSSISLGALSDPSSFTNTIAIGHKARASGTGGTGNTIAIGFEARTSSNMSTAVGAYTFAKNQSTTAVGVGSTADGQQSTAIGAYCDAENYGFAAGRNSNATGQASVAIGNTANANGTDIISIGSGAGAGASKSNPYAICIGATAGGKGFQTEAIMIGKSAGYASLASPVGEKSIAIGSNSGVGSGPNTISLGEYAGYWNTQGSYANNAIFINASGSTGQVRKYYDHYAIDIRTNDSDGHMWFSKDSDWNFGAAVTAPAFIGDGSQLTGISGGGGLDSAGVLSVFDNQQSIRLGEGANTQNTSGEVAIGYLADATGADAIAIGYDANATALFSLSLGRGSNATFEDATAIGRSATSSQADTIAIGTSAVASGSRSVAIGNGTDATAASAVALGNSAQALATNAIAIGLSADTNLNADGIAIGSNTEVSGATGISIGQNAASSQASVAIGANSSVTTGTETTAIGPFAGGTGSASLALGRGAKANANNTIVLAATGGNSTVATQFGIDIRTSAAGSLTYDTTNDWTFGAGVTMTDLTSSGVVIFSALPTTDPVNAGQLWNDAGTLKVSAG